MSPPMNNPEQMNPQQQALLYLRDVVRQNPNITGPELQQLIMQRVPQMLQNLPGATPWMTNAPPPAFHQQFTNRMNYWMHSMQPAYMPYSTMVPMRGWNMMPTYPAPYYPYGYVQVPWAPNPYRLGGPPWGMYPGLLSYPRPQWQWTNPYAMPNLPVGPSYAPRPVVQPLRRQTTPPPAPGVTPRPTPTPAPTPPPAPTERPVRSVDPSERAIVIDSVLSLIRVAFAPGNEAQRQNYLAQVTPFANEPQYAFLFSMNFPLTDGRRIRIRPASDGTGAYEFYEVGDPYRPFMERVGKDYVNELMADPELTANYTFAIGDSVDKLRVTKVATGEQAEVQLEFSLGAAQFAYLTGIRGPLGNTFIAGERSANRPTSTPDAMRNILGQYLWPSAMLPQLQGVPGVTVTWDNANRQFDCERGGEHVGVNVVQAIPGQLETTMTTSFGLISIAGRVNTLQLKEQITRIPWQRQLLTALRAENGVNTMNVASSANFPYIFTVSAETGSVSITIHQPTFGTLLIQGATGPDGGAAGGLRAWAGQAATAQNMGRLLRQWNSPPAA